MTSVGYRQDFAITNDVPYFPLISKLWSMFCEYFQQNDSVLTRQNFQAWALGDFHDQAWGQKFSSGAMHIYMGENLFSIWSYNIGDAFKSIQLSFDIYRVSYHHLVHDIHQIICGLHNLCKFQWAITSCLTYGMPATLWWLMWHQISYSNTLQLPSEPWCTPPYVMTISHCLEGGSH